MYSSFISGMGDSPSYTVLSSSPQAMSEYGDANRAIYRSLSNPGQEDSSSTKARFGSMSDSEVNEATGIRTSAEIVAAELQAYMSNGESSDDGEDLSMPESPMSSSSCGSNYTSTMFELDDLVEKQILEIAQLQTGSGCDETVQIKQGEQ